jgi:hypothetical protein
MTMKEVEYRTPNGLHDAYLLSFSVDYRESVLRINLNLWTGDLSSEIEKVREAYREATFIVTGLRYFVIESPAKGSSVDEPSYIDGFETRDSDITRASLPDLNGEAFRYSLFVGEWNSFIHFAGSSADVLPTDLMVQKTGM